MKKNIYTYIAAATLFLTSCTDLDQSSISTIDKDNFYQNESDIKVALNGVYQVLTDGSMNGPWNDELIFLNDLQSEYARRGTANSAAITEIGDFAITPTNAFVETAWLYRYKAINRANILIEKVSNSQQLSAQSAITISVQPNFFVHYTISTSSVCLAMFPWCCTTERVKELPVPAKTRFTSR